MTDVEQAALEALLVADLSEVVKKYRLGDSLPTGFSALIQAKAALRKAQGGRPDRLLKRAAHAAECHRVAEARAALDQYEKEVGK